MSALRLAEVSYHLLWEGGRGYEITWPYQWLANGFFCAFFYDCTFFRNFVTNWRIITLVEPPCGKVIPCEPYVIKMDSPGIMQVDESFRLFLGLIL